MDSVTQLALGAGVAAAVLGPKIGPRRAALVGAALGTAPDLDVFVPLGDPVSDFVLHRGPTHSLVIQALATPLFAEPLRLLFSQLQEHRLAVYLAVYLCFATHALLDAMTIYGTRLLWPLVPDPVGLGSIFIIDPLYTVPLLVALVWALCAGQWTGRFARALTVALAVSTGYLAWSAGAQQIAAARGEAALASLGIEAERVTVTPTPFNTLFWRVIAVESERYTNLYVPLIGGSAEVTAYAHPRGGRLLACIEPIPAARELGAFSKGFFKLEEVDGRLRVVDLRMGVTPDYVFQFEVAKRDGEAWTPIAPVRLPVRREAGQDFDWLWSGILGERAVRPREAAALLGDVVPVRVAGPTAPPSSACSPG
jgi:inner membrane protein